ncbi:NAD-dependent epimerase/dehydratase family protein [Streptomyces lutosisoli]|uniref:NAD-dependent epimerase/dehydratase family protein n=1 Tax=Streptomyces lutosisoli TaxID=2665721 RepID=A0ABW2VVN3_9ACTN
MQVLVAGGTGVIGRQLVPLLRSAGHDVVVLSRPGRSATAADRLGAKVVEADALDRAAVAKALRSAAPQAVVNMLTAIPAEINPRRLAKDFELTNRLRTEGTRNLLEAARDIGVQRVVSQGLAYAYDPGGTGAADEEAPLWKNPPKQFVPVLGALRDLERQTLLAEGAVLRLGHLYGPGTIYAPDGSFVQQVRAGKVPLVGGGTATFSFTHTRDAAAAVVAAIKSDYNGVLNVVDDEPAPMNVWLPELADILGARKPKGAPAALARMAVGGWGVAFMTQLRGADNARAKLQLDWTPRYPTWRTGFTAELRNTASPAAA